MPPVGAVFGALITGLTSAITSAIGGLVSFSSLTAFLASPIGSLVIGLGLQLVSGLFVRRPQAPSIEAGKVNVRLPEPDRWLCAGFVRQGGGIIFAEFDADGNFWYVTIHSDSILTEVVSIFFDDIEVEVDVSGNVITNDFCFDTENNLYSGSGTRRVKFRHWMRTYTETNPTPPAVTELQTAFPGANGWTVDHKLVGTTYSVVCVDAVSTTNRYKLFRWRGPVGVGEPAVSIAGNWSKIYDPRDGTQTLGDKSTYKFSRNPALIWAWFRTQKYGRNKTESEINWTRVGQQATICDEIVVGIESSQPRYQCGIAVPESKERNVAEQEILYSADANIVFDDDGKAWPRVGYYEPATLSLNRYRDIMAMESVEAQNGESLTQGVVVRYIDPAAKFTTQPSRPWKNPLYYVAGQAPKYLVVDILTCQNHNQAMRLAKAIGERSQSAYKLLPTVGLRGLKARHERIIDLTYDNTFAGEHEIVTPVEIDKSGMFTGFGIVPIDANRWTLLSGEEQPKPVYSVPDANAGPQLPTGVIATYINGQIKATFDPSPREDWTYQFQYQIISESDWNDLTVNMLTQTAVSGTLSQSFIYNVRYRTRSSSGLVSDWNTPYITVNANDYSSLIAEMTAVGETPDEGRQQLIYTVINYLKNAGLWTKIEHLWVLAAHGNDSALIDWKFPNGAKLVLQGTVNFKIDRGFKSDGTTGNIKTGFNPGDAGSHIFALNSNHMMISVENIASAATDMGNTSHLIRAHDTSNNMLLRNSSTTSDILAATGNGGFICVSRTGSADYRLNINGVASTVTRTSSTITNGEFYLCGFSGQFSPKRQSMACVGSGLTDAEVEDLREIRNFYLSAIGAI